MCMWVPAFLGGFKVIVRSIFDGSYLHGVLSVV